MNTILFLVLLNIGASNALLDQGLGPSVTELIQQMNSTLNKDIINLKQEHAQEKQQNQQEIAKLNSTILKLKQEQELYQQKILSLNQELVVLKSECETGGAYPSGAPGLTSLVQVHVSNLTYSSHKTVVFSATLTHQINSAGDNQVIVYDRVLANEGSGYNPNIGHFTAPVQGHYYFSVTVMGRPDEILSLNIVKNGSPFEEVYSGNTKAGYTSSTEGLVVPLEVGDMVWVVYNGGSRYIHCCNYNSFTGFLI